MTPEQAHKQVVELNKYHQTHPIKYIQYWHDMGKGFCPSIKWYQSLYYKLLLFVSWIKEYLIPNIRYKMFSFKHIGKD